MSFNGSYSGSHVDKKSNEISIYSVDVSKLQDLNSMLMPQHSDETSLNEPTDLARFQISNAYDSKENEEVSTIKSPPSTFLSHAPPSTAISYANAILICANGEFDRCDKENIATYYCDSCEPALVMCDECNGKIHNNPACQHHNRIPIRNMAYKDFEAAYRKYLIAQIEKYADDLDDVNLGIDERICELKQPLENTVSTIHRHFIEVDDALQKREKNLVKASKELYNKKISLLRRQKALISIVVSNADRAIGFQENASSNYAPMAAMSPLSKYSTPSSNGKSKLSGKSETSIDDLLTILKGLQDKYVTNQEPVESADIPIHFDSLNFLRKLNEYGMLAGPPPPAQLACEMTNAQARVRLQWEYPYCRRHYQQQYANDDSDGANPNSSYIDPTKVLFLIEVAVVRKRAVPPLGAPPAASSHRTSLEISDSVFNGKSGGANTNGFSSRRASSYVNISGSDAFVTDTLSSQDATSSALGAFSPRPDRDPRRNSLAHQLGVGTPGAAPVAPSPGAAVHTAVDDEIHEQLVQLEWREAGRISASGAWSAAALTRQLQQVESLAAIAADPESSIPMNADNQQQRIATESLSLDNIKLVATAAAAVSGSETKLNVGDQIAMRSSTQYEDSALESAAIHSLEAHSSRIFDSSNKPQVFAGAVNPRVAMSNKFSSSFRHTSDAAAGDGLGRGAGSSNSSQQVAGRMAHITEHGLADDAELPAIENDQTQTHSQQFRYSSATGTDHISQHQVTRNMASNRMAVSFDSSAIKSGSGSPSTIIRKKPAGSSIRSAVDKIEHRNSELKQDEVDSGGVRHLAGDDHCQPNDPNNSAANVDTSSGVAVVVRTEPTYSFEHQRDESLMVFELDIQDYIGCNLKFRVKAVIVTLNDKNDEFMTSSAISSSETGMFNASLIKNDIKTKCEKLSSEYISSSFPTSKWAVLAKAFQTPSKIEVSRDFAFHSTQKHKEEYRNPAQLGSHNKNFVFSEMSSYGADFCSPYKFVCHAHTKLIGVNFTKPENNSWMAIDLGPNRKLLPNYYCLRHGRADGNNVLRNWTLQARVSDKSEWVTLRWHVDDLGLAARGFSVSFWPISTTAASSDKKKDKKVRKRNAAVSKAPNRSESVRRGIRRQSNKNMIDSSNDDSPSVGDKSRDDEAAPPKPFIAKRSQALKRSGVGDRSSWIVALRMLSEAAAQAASTGILKPYKSSATTSAVDGAHDASSSAGSPSAPSAKAPNKRSNNDFFSQSPPADSTDGDNKSDHSLAPLFPLASATTCDLIVAKGGTSQDTHPAAVAMGYATLPQQQLSPTKKRTMAEHIFGRSKEKETAKQVEKTSNVGTKVRARSFAELAELRSNSWNSDNSSYSIGARATQHGLEINTGRSGRFQDIGSLTDEARTPRLEVDISAGGDVSSLVRDGSSKSVFPSLRRTAPGRSTVSSNSSSVVSKGNSNVTSFQEEAVAAYGMPAFRRRRSSLAKSSEASGGSPSNSSSVDSTPVAAQMPKSARSRSIFLSATARFTGGLSAKTPPALETNTNAVTSDNLNGVSPSASAAHASTGATADTAKTAASGMSIVRSSFSLFRRASVSSTNSTSTNNTGRSNQNPTHDSSSRIEASTVQFVSSVNSSIHTQRDDLSSAGAMVTGRRGSFHNGSLSSSRRNSVRSSYERELNSGRTANTYRRRAYSDDTTSERHIAHSMQEAPHSAPIGAEPVDSPSTSHISGSPSGWKAIMNGSGGKKSLMSHFLPAFLHKRKSKGDKAASGSPQRLGSPKNSRRGSRNSSRGSRRESSNSPTRSRRNSRRNSRSGSIRNSPASSHLPNDGSKNEFEECDDVIHPVLDSSSSISYVHVDAEISRRRRHSLSVIVMSSRDSSPRGGKPPSDSYVRNEAGLLKESADLSLGANSFAEATASAATTPKQVTNSTGGDSGHKPVPALSLRIPSNSAMAEGASDLNATDTLSLQEASFRETLASSRESSSHMSLLTKLFVSQDKTDNTTKQLQHPGNSSSSSSSTGLTLFCPVRSAHSWEPLGEDADNHNEACCELKGVTIQRSSSSEALDSPLQEHSVEGDHRGLSSLSLAHKEMGAYSVHTPAAVKESIGRNVSSASNCKADDGSKDFEDEFPAAELLSAGGELFGSHFTRSRSSIQTQQQQTQLQQQQQQPPLSRDTSGKASSITMTARTNASEGLDTFRSNHGVSVGRSGIDSGILSSRQFATHSPTAVFTTEVAGVGAIGVVTAQTLAARGASSAAVAAAAANEDNDNDTADETETLATESTLSRTATTTGMSVMESFPSTGRNSRNTSLSNLNNAGAISTYTSGNGINVVSQQAGRSISSSSALNRRANQESPITISPVSPFTPLTPAPPTRGDDENERLRLDGSWQHRLNFVDFSARSLRTMDSSRTAGGQLSIVQISEPFSSDPESTSAAVGLSLSEHNCDIIGEKAAVAPKRTNSLSSLSVKATNHHAVVGNGLRSSLNRLTKAPSTHQTSASRASLLSNLSANVSSVFQLFGLPRKESIHDSSRQQEGGGGGGERESPKSRNSSISYCSAYSDQASGSEVESLEIDSSPVSSALNTPVASKVITAKKSAAMSSSPEAGDRSSGRARRFSLSSVSNSEVITQLEGNDEKPSELEGPPTSLSTSRPKLQIDTEYSLKSCIEFPGNPESNKTAISTDSHNKQATPSSYTLLGSYTMFSLGSILKKEKTSSSSDKVNKVQSSFPPHSWSDRASALNASEKSVTSTADAVLGGVHLGTVVEEAPAVDAVDLPGDDSSGGDKAKGGTACTHIISLKKNVKIQSDKLEGPVNRFGLRDTRSSKSSDNFSYSNKSDDSADESELDEDDNSNGYRCFRIVQHKGFMTSSHLCCAGIELYGKLTEVLTPATE